MNELLIALESCHRNTKATSRRESYKEEQWRSYLNTKSEHILCLACPGLETASLSSVPADKWMRIKKPERNCDIRGLEGHNWKC